MIKLFSLKQQKKDGTDPNGTKGMGQKKSSAAQLRITKGKLKWMITSFHFEFCKHDVYQDSINGYQYFWFFKHLSVKLSTTRHVEGSLWKCHIENGEMMDAGTNILSYFRFTIVW